MRRFLLLTGFLLLCLITQAQSVTYSCRYWYDQNHEQAVVTTFNDSNWQAEIDVGLLSDGLHVLHLQAMDTSMKWSAPMSYLFLKTTEVQQDNYVYHCWFDEDFTNQQNNVLGSGHLLLDVTNLEEGMHTVYVMLENSTLSATQSYTFMKIAVENPSVEWQYICWFDQDYSSAQTGPLGSGIFELEVGELSSGLHTVNVQLDNGNRTAPRSYLFYKHPLGGYGLARWEYWINDDWDNRSITTMSPSLDTLDIISLLPVGHPDLRSSCFHFHPNGDASYISAKNKISFRFWDSELHFIDKSAFYVDEQVQQGIVATTFERNTTETFAAPRNNQIQWFKLDAVVGDSLSFVASKACTMQLFAPSGEEVYNVSGSESVAFGGLHAWENGTYYLAIHDMTGSGETVSVTYNHLDKYVVLAYTPTEIGNTWGVFEVDVLGNGFDKLSNVILANGLIWWQMDSIMYSHNSEAAIRFAMDSTTSNGDYDLVLCFEDFVGELDTIVLSNAIQVADAQFGTIDIDYSYQFSTAPPYLIRVSVTNNGNVEYQGVPVLFAHTNVNHVEFGLYHDWLTVQEDYFENGGRAIYYTDNLFNQGIEGNLIPLIIPRLGPHGTREITFNVDIGSGTNFDFYAWGGIPWSLKTEEAYEADAYYCQTHPESPGWTGNHSGGNGGNSGSSYGGGSSGGANFTVGTHNANGGNCHGTGSDAYYDSCDGPPDPCDIAGHVAGDLQECLCGVTMGIGQTLGNMLNAMHGLNHRAQLNGVGIHSQEEAELYGLGDMWQSAYHRRLRTPGSLLRGALGHCTGLLPGAAQHAADAALEAWGMLDDDCAQPPRQSPSMPRPVDPNDIQGYISESGSHYMRQEIQNVQYEIEFENDTTLATAAAHTIIVRDTLNRSRFDLNSLAARSVTIGDKRLDLNGEQTFARTLDLRPELYVIAQINQDYDPTTGIIQWTIQSLDPMTMEPTDDPNQGVLPVNYYGNGVGFIDYSINLKQAFPDGTKIRNRAGIIFDQNEVIMTPTWTNIIDAVKPTSYIENVTFEADTLNFSFVSSDNRSGVWYHTLYYRNNSTEMEWQVKVPRIFENSYMLQFDEYQTTEYLVMAVDSAGNHEEKDMMAEYVYYYDGPEPVCQSVALSHGWNWFSSYVEITLQDLKTALVDALPGTTINIKSQTQNVKYQNGRWAGQLTALDLTRMYMITVENDCEISLVGMPINLSGLTATINNGANWLAFPYSESMTVTDFFGSFPMSNDQVKSQSRNARYQGGRWGGQLNTLMPGKGYIYISNSPGTRTFTFPISTK